MKITIGAYDAATGSVSVLFEHAGVSHERAVNAVHDEAGDYDEAATAARVDDVARGVVHKIAVGAITEAPPPPAPLPPAEDGNEA